mmetsp:Transcript_29638/g.39410  ORF Transcript_29638/g.39410 Transcript_29638/m.39410 type:complete len:306 (+) Transcript_29638:2361-3278(+)
MRARVKLHVAMVVKHPHGGLKVHELDWVHSADVLVHGLLLDDELVQLLRSQVLREAELLADLEVAEALVDPALVLPVRRVEVIFDAVVGAAWELFSDVRPLVPQLFVQVENLLLFDFVDRRLINVGIQVIVPSLAALLACASADFEFFFELISDESPLLGAVLLDELHDCIVLLLRPKLSRGLLLLAATHAAFFDCAGLMHGDGGIAIVLLIIVFVVIFILAAVLLLVFFVGDGGVLLGVFLGPPTLLLLSRGLGVHLFFNNINVGLRGVILLVGLQIFLRGSISASFPLPHCGHRSKFGFELFR